MAPMPRCLGNIEITPFSLPLCPTPPSWILPCSSSSRILFAIFREWGNILSPSLQIKFDAVSFFLYQTTIMWNDWKSCRNWWLKSKYRFYSKHAISNIYVTILNEKLSILLNIIGWCIKTKYRYFVIFCHDQFCTSIWFGENYGDRKMTVGRIQT